MATLSLHPKIQFMKTMSGLLLLSISLNLHAQKTIPVFGEIQPQEIQLNSCNFQRDANAVKLFDVQEVEFEPSPFGGKIVTRKRVRIKILNEKGFHSATIT